MAETAERTAALMDASASSAAHAKTAVPPPKPHDWGESLRSFATGGAVVDAVAQDQEQSDAHAEAVRIMTNVYSVPINDHRAAIPTYPQLIDPTMQPPPRIPGRRPAPSIPVSHSPWSAPARTGAGTSPTRSRQPLRCRV